MRSDEPLTSAPRWYEVEHATPVASEDDHRALAARVKSRGVEVDGPELRGGGFAVVEVGDGQVSGLPQRACR